MVCYVCDIAGKRKCFGRLGISGASVMGSSGSVQPFMKYSSSDGCQVGVMPSQSGLKPNSMRVMPLKGSCFARLSRVMGLADSTLARYRVSSSCSATAMALQLGR